MYVEDVDLCWRLRRAGWRIAYEPGGEVTHVQGVERVAAPVPDDRRAPSFALPLRGQALARSAPAAARARGGVPGRARRRSAMAEHALRRRPRLPKVTE